MSKKDKKQKIEVFDTLFRDGMQMKEMKISVENAMKIVRKMDELSFSYAELGFAGANEFSGELIGRAIKENFKNLKVAAFGRTRKANEKVEDAHDVKAILELGVPVATIVCKSRLMDVENSLKTTGEKNLEMIFDTVAHLKKNGLEVILDLEHAVDAWCGRGNFGKNFEKAEKEKSRKHFWDVVKTGIKAGADCTVVCDTNGGGAPEEMAEIFDALIKKYPDHKFGVHCHNDNDLATACTREAVLHGAKHVQGVVNGYGERCGNMNLNSVISRLQAKDGFEILPKDSLEKLTSLSKEVSLAFNKNSNEFAPFVGAGAFGTFAGMHASSECRDDGAYLQCDPSLVGNKKQVGVNGQSGKANVAFLADQLGISLQKEEIDEFVKKFKDEMEFGVFERSEESFVLACKEIKGELPNFFSVEKFTVGVKKKEGKIEGRAMLDVVVNDEKKKIVAFGDGAFDALSKGLLDGLLPYYPKLSKVKLKSFDLHALDVLEKGTSAKVLVSTRFAKNGDSWTTAGVSASSIEAGFRALALGLKWFLVNF